MELAGQSFHYRQHVQEPPYGMVRNSHPLLYIKFGFTEHTTQRTFL